MCTSHFTSAFFPCGINNTFFWTEARQVKGAETFFKFHWQHFISHSHTYCWFFKMLHIDYWFQLSGADFEGTRKWRQSFKSDTVRSGVSASFTAVCLEEIIWTDSILISRKPCRNIKTFNLLSEQTEEGTTGSLCHHTLPQAEPFIYQTLPHRGVCCYFWASNNVFFPKFSWSWCLLLSGCSQNSHSYTHRRWLARVGLFVAWDRGVGFNTDRLGEEGRGDTGDQWGPRWVKSVQSVGGKTCSHTFNSLQSIHPFSSPRGQLRSPRGWSQSQQDTERRGQFIQMCQFTTINTSRGFKW